VFHRDLLLAPLSELPPQSPDPLGRMSTQIALFHWDLLVLATPGKFKSRLRDKKDAPTSSIAAIGQSVPFVASRESNGVTTSSHFNPPS
jgi:hypothetical protein